MPTLFLMSVQTIVAQSLERKRKMQNKLKTKYTCCMKDLLKAKLQRVGHLIYQASQKR